MLFCEFTRHGAAFEFEDGLPRDVRTTRNVDGGDPPVCFPAPDRDVTAPNSAAPCTDGLNFRYIFSFN